MGGGDDGVVGDLVEDSGALRRGGLAGESWNECGSWSLLTSVDVELCEEDGFDHDRWMDGWMG